MFSLKSSNFCINKLIPNKQKWNKAHADYCNNKRFYFCFPDYCLPRIAENAFAKNPTSITRIQVKIMEDK